MHLLCIVHCALCFAILLSVASESKFFHFGAGAVCLQPLDFFNTIETKQRDNKEERKIDEVLGHTRESPVLMAIDGHQ